MAKATKAVLYSRVSTDRQGKSGLGLEAQQAAMTTWVKSNKAEVLEEFVEVESGKKSDRPELAKALKLAKRQKATLVIAKLDRLSRNASFLLSLRDSGVEFVCTDMPEANRLTIGIMAVMAEHEREMISERTKAAMAAKKARCEATGEPYNVGNPNGFAEDDRSKGPQERSRKSLAFVQGLAHWFQQTAEMSLNAAARHLNDNDVPTARGGLWTPTTVRSARSRLGLA